MSLTEIGSSQMEFMGRQAGGVAHDYNNTLSVIMPEMKGFELSERLKSLYPGLKCMFMSGYTANAIAHHGVLDEGVYFMQKPFSKRDLATIVRKVLDDKKS